MTAKLLIARIVYWLQGLRENPRDLFCELGVEPTDHVLEIGCALGYHTAPLASIVTRGKLCAVDVWREGIDHARTRIGSAHHVQLLCLSADTVSLPASSLDKIVCFDTLHALPDPAQAVKQWTTWLKPGGVLLYKDPEIPPDDVSVHAGGSLRCVNVVRGICMLSRAPRGPV
ncbi:MAG TPA: class I SAM-dependent methyltransferase [Candidatus Acetothermia bacterium]|nr:class I SAM-dependent methyltransferase [Candidatus Acetothermia bacterium]